MRRFIVFLAFLFVAVVTAHALPAIPPAHRGSLAVGY